MVDNITFFFPYRIISGVPITFANCANYLLSNSKIKVNIIDYEGGVLIRNCNKNNKLNFIKFEDFKACIIDFDTYLIIQGGLPYKLRNELSIGNKVKIIQWVAHEYNLVPFTSHISFFRQLQERYFFMYKIFFLINYKKMNLLSTWIQKMINRGAIAFMSKKMFDVTSKYLTINENLIKFSYLPLMSDGKTLYSEEKIMYKSKKIHKRINMAWLGRIGDFKIHILNYTIKKLSYLSELKKINIKFYIIGDGSFKNILNVNCQNEYFRIIDLGLMEKNKSDEFIYNKIDVILGMGTSSIDGGRVGLPVILLDQSYIKISKDYVFRFLHKTKNYDLGHPITNSDFKKGNSSIEIIVNKIIKDYKLLSDKSYKYFRDNHSTKNSVNHLFKLIKNKSFYYYDEIDKELLEIGLFRKLYLWYLKNIKKSYY